MRKLSILLVVVFCFVFGLSACNNAGTVNQEQEKLDVTITREQYEALPDKSEYHPNGTRISTGKDLFYEDKIID